MWELLARLRSEQSDARPATTTTGLRWGGRTAAASGREPREGGGHAAMLPQGSSLLPSAPLNGSFLATRYPSADMEPQRCEEEEMQEEEAGPGSDCAGPGLLSPCRLLPSPPTAPRRGAVRRPVLNSKPRNRRRLHPTPRRTSHTPGAGPEQAGRLPCTRLARVRFPAHSHVWLVSRAPSGVSPEHLMGVTPK